MEWVADTVAHCMVSSVGCHQVLDTGGELADMVDYDMDYA